MSSKTVYVVSTSMFDTIGVFMSVEEAATYAWKMMHDRCDEEKIATDKIEEYNTLEELRLSHEDSNYTVWINHAPLRGE